MGPLGSGQAGEQPQHVLPLCQGHERLLVIVVEVDPAATAPAEVIEALHLILRQLKLAVGERGFRRGTSQRELQAVHPAGKEREFGQRGHVLGEFLLR